MNVSLEAVKPAKAGKETGKESGKKTSKETSTKPTVAKKPVEVIENDAVKQENKKMGASKAAKCKAKTFPGKKKKAKVCRVVEAPKPDCSSTPHGCCPDGISPAKGPFETGLLCENKH